jgi:hypothetical protein
LSAQPQPTTPEEPSYPRSWDFKKDGTLPGRHRELRAVKAADFQTGALVDKVVWECQHAETGEIVSVWITDTVLFNTFSRELRRRSQLGQVFPKAHELITIEPLGKNDEKRYNDYRVTFEHGASPVTAEEVLLRGNGEEGEDVELLDVAEPADEHGDVPF